jgi:hypothetical protein
MKAENFCTIFIYSIINFVIFLLSISFLISVDGVNKYYEKIKGNQYNHRPAIVVLFIFFIISFLIFLGVMIYILKLDRFDQENEGENQYIGMEEQRNANNYEDIRNNINGNIPTTERLNHDNNDILNLNNNVISGPATANIMNNMNSGNNNNANNNNRINQNNRNRNNNNEDLNINNNNGEETMDQEEAIPNFKNLMRILFYSFLFCQIVYLIELIVLTVFTSGLKNEYEKKIYKNSIIFGYIFFCLFLLLYIFLFVVKFTQSGRNSLKSFVNKIDNQCLNEFIENRCIDLTNCFRTKAKRDQENQIEKRRKIEENEVKIGKLKDYKKDLESFNVKLRDLRNNGKPLSAENIPDSEFIPLKIFRIIS